MMDICQNLQNTCHYTQSKPTAHNTQSEPRGKLWTVVHTVMCQCGFVNCNTCATLMGNMDRVGGGVARRALSVWAQKVSGNSL